MTVGEVSINRKPVRVARHNRLANPKPSIAVSHSRRIAWSMKGCADLDGGCQESCSKNRGWRRANSGRGDRRVDRQASLRGAKILCALVRRNLARYRNKREID